MFSKNEHSVRGYLNNAPSKIALNKDSTLVATRGGNVYQAGFINSKIESSFKDDITHDPSLGHVIDLVAVEGKYYLLNAAGSVFERDYNVANKAAGIREIYTPVSCNSDKAVQIVGGRKHVVILTENGKVFGAGDNSEYQLVPQGQCKYDSAVELLVTDTNFHDDKSCNSFTGTLTEFDHPVICRKQTTAASSIKDTKCDVLLGYINYTDAVLRVDELCAPDQGKLGIPVYGDISYFGFLCVDTNGCVTGSVTYTITRLAIKCGGFLGHFTTKRSDGCEIREFNASSTHVIEIFRSTENACGQSPCSGNSIPPLSATVGVQGKCGTCADLAIRLPSGFRVPGAAFDANCDTIILALDDQRTAITGLCDVDLAGLDAAYEIEVELMYQVPLDGCLPAEPVEPKLEQPCWRSIAAGHDITALVNTCNQLYVFGSIHQVRSFLSQTKDSTLQDFLYRNKTSISLPADQLCGSGSCGKREIDLSGVDVKIDITDEHDGCKRMSVCDFLAKLKNCSGNSECVADVCEPCDRYIYLNLCASQTRQTVMEAMTAKDIGSVTILNKLSTAKQARGCSQIRKIHASESTVVDFSISGYCVGNDVISLGETLVLDFCNDGPNVILYVDTDYAGGVRFVRDAVCNVEFSIQIGSVERQYLLNYGKVVDPVELSDLRYALSALSKAGCRTPYQTKVTNTYLRGGDVVRFCISNHKNVRLAITPDVVTVFRVDRRIAQVEIGYNSLHVLVSGLSCPNEVLSLGSNCAGELGHGGQSSSIVFQTVDRRAFDCQVVKIFAGDRVTFYLTQSGQIYSSGHWKTWLQSNRPEALQSVDKSWKVDQIIAAANHIVMLGEDGSIFGLGDNTMGELGAGHLNLINKPTAISFFYDLSNHAVEQLYRGPRREIDVRQQQQCTNGGAFAQFGAGDRCTRNLGVRDCQADKAPRRSHQSGPSHSIDELPHGVPSLDQFENFQIPKDFDHHDRDSAIVRPSARRNNSRRGRPDVRSFQRGY